MEGKVHIILNNESKPLYEDTPFFGAVHFLFGVSCDCPIEFPIPLTHRTFSLLIA